MRDPIKRRDSTSANLMSIGTLAATCDFYCPSWNSTLHLSVDTLSEKVKPVYRTFTYWPEATTINLAALGLPTQSLFSLGLSPDSFLMLHFSSGSLNNSSRMLRHAPSPSSAGPDFKDQQSSSSHTLVRVLILLETHAQSRVFFRSKS